MREKLKVESEIYKVDKEGSNIKANATVTLSGENSGALLKINNVKVIEGKNGIFVALPTREIVNKETNEKRYEPVIRFDEKTFIESTNENGETEKKSWLENMIKGSVKRAFESPELKDEKITKDERVDSEQVNVWASSTAKNNTVYLGGIINIPNVFLNESKEGEKYVKMPSYSFEKDGEKKYKDYVYAPAETMREKIKEAVIKARENIQEKEKQNEQESNINEAEDEDDLDLPF